ncbi:MAG TPA: hypothetical protein DCX95_01095 [Elusimicrobia bacterium]|nr:hypothetical protein [Elusimicrobiota bacterium]
MATIKFFVGGKKRELASIYVRLSAGRGIDLFIPSGLKVDPQTWSNKTESIKQRIRTDDDEKLIDKLAELKKHIMNELRNFTGDCSKDWLLNVVDKYHNKRAENATTLNEYINRLIREAKSGDRKNKSAMNLSPGTYRGWQGFQRIFNEYQGIYTPKRLDWRKKHKKPIRPVKKVDFENITIDFYNSFVKFLSDEGYDRGTMGRFIKELKMFMKKSLEDKLHTNREFEYSAFKGISGNSFSVYLTRQELDKIYNADLSKNPGLDIARDAFCVLSETALRISDYSKVDVNIRKSEDGTKLIYITQKKTGGQIVIPLSARLEEILSKYNGHLPCLADQYINKRIKIVAKLCGIDEIMNWQNMKYGETFEKKARKWQLITCHTARRTACSLMFLAGIPTISIMQISGHRSEKNLLTYIKVTPEENARKLAGHDYFRNGLKVV